jgi:hypothetical protein
MRRDNTSLERFDECIVLLVGVSRVGSLTPVWLGDDVIVEDPHALAHLTEDSVWGFSAQSVLHS